MAAEMTFQALVDAVALVHREMTSQAGRAVNMALTLRNWLIGRHIAEFQLRGADRAEYGEAVLEHLARQLRGHCPHNSNTCCLPTRRPRLCRRRPHNLVCQPRS
jgi:hypothetical protein